MSDDFVFDPSVLALGKWEYCAILFPSLMLATPHLKYGRPLPEGRSLSASCDTPDVFEDDTVTFGVQESRETVGELFLRLDAAQSTVKPEETMLVPDWVDDFESSPYAKVQSMKDRLGLDDEAFKKLGDASRLLPKAGVSNHS